MSNQQKTAFYHLTIGILTVVTYLILLIPFDGRIAPVAFAVMALTGLAPALFQDGANDERERAIARRAGLVGGMASYLFVVVAAMLIWAIRFRADPPTIEVSVLPTLVMGAAVVLLIAHSTTVLWLYRRPLDVGS